MALTVSGTTPGLQLLCSFHLDSLYLSALGTILLLIHPSHIVADPEPVIMGTQWDLGTFDQNLASICYLLSPNPPFTLTVLQFPFIPQTLKQKHRSWAGACF